MRQWSKINYWWRSRGLWAQRLTLWIGGVGVGLVAILFAALSDFAYEAFHHVVTWHSWLALVITPVGLAFSAWVTNRYFPGAKGSGIPQAIAALKLPEERWRKVLSLRLAMAKIALTVFGILVGASVGREGPTVQVGASIMARLGQTMRCVVPIHQRSMILAGAAAGIAAAFNTPLAGVVFAIEELAHSLEAKTSGAVFTAVILAGVTSLALVGNVSYFGHTSASLDLGNAWLGVAVIGLCGGIAGGVFSQSLISISRRGFPGFLGRFHTRRPIVFAALCGLGIAVVGLAFGNATYGTGYQEARGALEGGALPDYYFFGKLAASFLSYLSGIPGGIFSPSLAVGAGLGDMVAHWLPAVPVEAAILLGMVAYFCGVVQSPITAVVIVMEMTDNQRMTVPLMAAALIAFVVSRAICPTPFYKALAERFIELNRGIPETQGRRPSSEGGAADPK